MLRRIRPVVLAATLVAGAVHAQSDAPKIVVPQPSPAASFTQRVGTTEVGITWSAPGVRGRKVFNDVVPLGQLWRAGANKCTTLKVSTPVSIEGKPLPAGSYCLFLLPEKTGWTFILSKNTEQWGTDEYKQSDDALRVPAATSTIPKRERLAFSVIDFDDEKGTLAMEWDTTRVAVKLDTGTRARAVADAKALKTDDPQPYTAAANYFLEAGIEPQLAMQMVDRSIALKEGWRNTWVKAQLLHAAGKDSDALKYAQRAQTLGKADAKNFFAADAVASALVSWKK